MLEKTIINEIVGVYLSLQAQIANFQKKVVQVDIKGTSFFIKLFINTAN